MFQGVNLREKKMMKMRRKIIESEVVCIKEKRVKIKEK